MKVVHQISLVRVINWVKLKVTQKVSLTHSVKLKLVMIFNILISVIPSRNSTTKRSSNREEVVLKVWKEGFTINDGELHSIDQPENREFLLLVARG